MGDRLGQSVFWLAGAAGLERADGSGVTRVALLARDGALDHVDVLDGTPGPGMRISDRAAAATGLGRGDRAHLAGTQVEVPIAGVYRDVSGLLPDGYWCPTPTCSSPRAGRRAAAPGRSDGPRDPPGAA